MWLIKFFIINDLQWKIYISWRFFIYASEPEYSRVYSRTLSLSHCVFCVYIEKYLHTRKKKSEYKKKKFINVMILRSGIAKTGKSNILCQLFSSIRNKLKLGTYRTLTNILLLTNGTVTISILTLKLEN